VTISGDAGERVYPASITKLFTAYVAGQYLAADKTVEAGDALDLVGWGSSVAELQKGDKITVEKLIAAMMLPSGNDAANVLAAEAGRALADDPEIAGVQEFVAEMNRQAQILGMDDTHFANPDGLHQDDHYSTLGDLAVLGTLALEDPVLMQYAGTAHETVQMESGAKQWKNTNALIDPESTYYCPYAIGLKTGQTPSAGSCLLSAFQYEERTLVIGVFGCPEEDDRFPDTLQLFNETIGYTVEPTDSEEQ
jgi:D-alanyl-D-alanine carboxypeptidase (penicillin-binding protein 5/6)